MKQNIRDLVDAYISTQDMSELTFRSNPYCFYQFDDDLAKERIKSMKIDNMILEILKLSKKFDSHNNRERETCLDCLRSAQDIYRHIIHFRSDISLYDVMNCLHDLSKNGDIFTHVCCTIERRVFYINDDPEMRDYYTDDEYGLDFSQWENI